MATTIKKLTLLTLCREKHITSKQLAQEARLLIHQVYVVEIGGYCQEEVVQQVIGAYNTLTKQNKTIHDIQWTKAVEPELPFSQRGARRL